MSDPYEHYHLPPPPAPCRWDVIRQTVDGKPKATVCLLDSGTGHHLFQQTIDLEMYGTAGIVETARHIVERYHRDRS